jgi:hypothetical protein
MRIDRLKKVLEALPEREEQFNIKIIGRIGVCGTVACAVGWYIVKFPEEGLGFSDSGIIETL